MKIRNVLIAALLCTASLAQAIKITNGEKTTIYIISASKKKVAIEPGKAAFIILPAKGLLRLDSSNQVYTYPRFPFATEIEVKETKARGKWLGKWGEWKYVKGTTPASLAAMGMA